MGDAVDPARARLSAPKATIVVKWLGQLYPELAASSANKWLDKKENLEAFVEDMESRVIEDSVLDLWGPDWGLNEVRRDLDYKSEISHQIPRRDKVFTFKDLLDSLGEKEDKSAITENSKARVHFGGAPALAKAHQAIGNVLVLSYWMLDTNLTAA